jgi:hypothetical protein
MRYAPAGGLMLLAVLASPGAAQQPREVYVVKDGGAEVRAMADDKPESYVTNRLKKGDTVVVVEEQPGGWLKIKPPAGSTSWISRAMLKDPITAKKIEVVDFEPGAPVFPGPADKTEKRPTVSATKLTRGYIVTRLDKEIRDEKEGWWIEIESPESEARYVRAESVERRQTPAVLPASATAPAEARPLRKSSHPSASVAPVGPSAAQMREQAVKADMSGDYAEAVRLYEEIVERFSDSQPKLVEMSRKRADYLRGKVDAGIKLQEPTKMPPTKSVSLGESKGAADRDREASGGSRWEQRSQELTDPKNVRTYRGWLTASYSQPIYGQKAYLLELNPPVAGLRMLYVVSGGVGLDGLVRKTVELRGPLTYHGEMRSYVMEVTQAGEAQ